MRRPLIIDFTNFGFRWFASKKPIHMLTEDCLSNIVSFTESLACDSTIITIDYGKSVYRKQLYPEYKANRVTDDPKKLKQMKQHFSNMTYCLKVLEGYFPCIKLKGIEADDIIAYIVTKFPNCVILSSDQDLLQLNVTQFSPNRSSFISLEKLGFTSVKQFIHAKAIAGDNSDNIKGLERVGMKTALKYLLKYDTDNYKELQERIPKNTKSKIEARILEGTEIIERNLKLVDLINYNDQIISLQQREDIDELLTGEDWI